MKNLIVKTALITIGSLIVLCLILWGVFSWFAPSVMVTVCDGLGMEKSAANYSVSVYEKSGEIEDLTELVERNYSCGKYRISAKYGELLLIDESFPSYCSDNSSLKQNVSGITAVSLYKTGDKNKALDIASSNTVGEFKKFNGLERLLDSAMENADIEFVTAIRVKIFEIELGTEDSEGTAHRDYVLGVCDNFLNPKA